MIAREQLERFFAALEAIVDRSGDDPWEDKYKYFMDNMSACEKDMLMQFTSWFDFDLEG